MDYHASMQLLGQQARAASHQLAKASSAQKNHVLHCLLKRLQSGAAELLLANQRDLERAASNSLSSAMVDRLRISEKTVASMCESLRQIIALNDPIGSIENLNTQPSGIQVGQMRIPLGVIGIIYESRPNVTIDATALCLKSGNAAILRGGSEARESNILLAQWVNASLHEANLPQTAVQVITDPAREWVGEMIVATDYLDVLIPRGGKSLIERLERDARVPMIKHLDGNCHLYVDDDADLEKAKAIAFNAKCHRYGTCNTIETLLVHSKVAQSFLPAMAVEYQSQNVELRVTPEVRALIPNYPNLIEVTEDDWSTEYLAPILAVRTVDSLDEAIAHINRYASHHTDAIVTEHYSKAQQFLREVDSASVVVNASTRFADGFEFGLGAEIGISTNKLHARGPVGLAGLTTLKYIVLGHGEIRI